MKELLELYIHIPFCIKKCAYCDFLSEPAEDVVIESYVEAIRKEITAYKQQLSYSKIISIFLGGGTPSILTEIQILEIFKALKDHCEMSEDIEITIEANPGTITTKKVAAWKRVGINRISIGLQSTHNSELKLLGRIHTYEEFLKGYNMVVEGGFTNINIDLMSATPGQTLTTYVESLKRITALTPSPTHISAYSLIIEEGTPFFEKYGPKRQSTNMDKLPKEEEEREMYQVTKQILERAGYNRYEVSNYAKEGYECVHNLGYWNRVSYLGMGIGAASLMQNTRYTNTRYTNTRSLQDYLSFSNELEKIKQNVEVLSRQEQIEEFFFLGLRKTNGISKNGFFDVFGKTVEFYYDEVIKKLKKEGLLIETKEQLQLSERGIDLSNYVLAEFLFV